MTQQTASVGAEPSLRCRPGRPRAVGRAKEFFKIDVPSKLTSATF